MICFYYTVVLFVKKIVCVHSFKKESFFCLLGPCKKILIGYVCIYIYIYIHIHGEMVKSMKDSCILCTLYILYNILYNIYTI